MTTLPANFDMPQGTWVARFDSDRCERPALGKVQDAYVDPTNGGEVLLDIVRYSATGERLGRVSPASGGPKKFEPACAAEFWEPIAKPDFLLMADEYFYGRRIKKLRNPAGPDAGSQG